MLAHFQRLKLSPNRSKTLAHLAARTLAAGVAMLLGICSFGQEAALVGPETEKRFPALRVPPGFKATLFACDPLIEYPSVLALGPRANSLFLAHDYMTGLGEKIVRKDEVRLVEDTNGDGYADKSTVWADGFNSIQGLAQHDGTVWVMHSPTLTLLRDVDGDGAAEVRHDLFSGLGWPPEKSIDRLHGANGVTFGHDGWLYLALGDRGCDVVRPEGDRLVLNGGGILRSRPDGKDLHVFAAGLRNIYDIALDEELNVFVRDNENDGGTYMIRVCQSFFGADHGYPYLYETRPDEAIRPMADLGRGSSAGGLVYLEHAFPAAYHGALFFCEWGKSLVTYPRERSGAGFAPTRELEFAAGAPADPYGFRPTDVIADRDGSLLVTDWADGQRPRRGRGRIYRIRHEEAQPDPGPGLNSHSYLARVQAQTELQKRGQAGIQNLQFNSLPIQGQLHAIWVIAHAGLNEELFRIAEGRFDPAVRAQAVRAIADRFDPCLVKHRLDAGRGDSEVAKRLALLPNAQDPRISLETVLALGRLRWLEAPDWFRANFTQPDPTMAHAIQQSLRRCENWPRTLEWLDSANTGLRDIGLRTLADQPNAAIVDGLLQRLASSTNQAHRRQYADLLARVHRKPGPWTYWGFRPGPKPPNPIDWEKSAEIAAALDRGLRDQARDVRVAVLKQAQREKVPIQPNTVIEWLRTEKEGSTVSALLTTLDSFPADITRDAVEAVIRDSSHSITNRLSALQLLVRGLDSATENRLLPIALTLEESPVLAETLRQVKRRETLRANELLLTRLQARTAPIRVAALEAFSSRAPVPEAVPPLLQSLHDSEPSVRAAAASVAGLWRLRDGTEQLLKLARTTEPEVRRNSLEALLRLHESRAIEPALQALAQDDAGQIIALKCLAEFGSAPHAETLTAVALRTRSSAFLQLAAHLLARWNRSAEVAAVQGASGILFQWAVSDAVSAQDSAAILKQLLDSAARPAPGWSRIGGTGPESRVNFGHSPAEATRIGYSEFFMRETARVEFRLSGSGKYSIWLNGKLVHQHTEPGNYSVDSGRFETEMQAGMNRIAAQITTAGSADLHVRFRHKGSTERHEKLSQLVLSRNGQPERGREIFQNAARSACLNCHRLGEKGGVVAPDLTGIGRRFSKIHLVESILEPSRAVAPAFQNLNVRLKDGQEIVGVKVSESEAALMLGDAQGQVRTVSKDQIESRRPLAASAMPEGLENGLTDTEFLDLISFLSEQK